MSSVVNCLLQVSGAIASTLTAPIDAVKTRVMTQHVAQQGAYMGMRAMFFQMLREEVQTCTTHHSLHVDFDDCGVQVDVMLSTSI